MSRQPLQAGPFFFAAMKNRIGRGRLLSRQPLQASHSSLRLRRIESDAKHRCRNNCCRRNHSPLASIRKFGLEIKNQCTKEGVNGEKLASIRKSGPEIKNRCMKDGVNGEKLASIRKFGLEIKNRCTKEGLNRQNLASIRKSGPEIKNQCRKQPIPQHAFITR